MYGVHNKGEVSRRKENAKDGVWGTHQAGPAPAIENENPTRGILATRKPEMEGGLPRGGGGGGASETMYCCLGKTNRLLLTKQKVPVGKQICRNTCA